MQTEKQNNPRRDITSLHNLTDAMELLNHKNIKLAELSNEFPETMQEFLGLKIKDTISGNNESINQEKMPENYSSKEIESYKNRILKWSELSKKYAQNQLTEKEMENFLQIVINQKTTFELILKVAEKMPELAQDVLKVKLFVKAIQQEPEITDHKTKNDKVVDQEISKARNIIKDESVEKRAGLRRDIELRHTNLNIDPDAFKVFLSKLIQDNPTISEREITELLMPLTTDLKTLISSKLEEIGIISDPEVREKLADVLSRLKTKNAEPGFEEAYETVKTYTVPKRKRSWFSRVAQGNKVLEK